MSSKIKPIDVIDFNSTKLNSSVNLNGYKFNLHYSKIFLPKRNEKNYSLYR